MTNNIDFKTNILNKYILFYNKIIDKENDNIHNNYGVVRFIQEENNLLIEDKDKIENKKIEEGINQLQIHRKEDISSLFPNMTNKEKNIEEIFISQSEEEKEHGF